MIETIKVNDINFVGFPNDYLFKTIKGGNSFPDSFIRDIIDKYVNKNSICIDIGANLGYISIYLSKKCKKVYSIEPQHIVYLQLCANLFINECFNVYPLELAAYSSNKMFDFATYQSGWVGTNNFNDYNNIGSIAAISLSQKDNGLIKGVRMDDIINEKVDFIKVDAQGGDIDAIFGCEELIHNYRPIIVFEYEHDMSTQNYHKQLSDLDEFIKIYQYNKRRLVGENYILDPK